MVDLSEIQAAYYMVAATGVLVAAIYYIYNMRIAQRNQELSLKALEQSAKTQELALKSQQQNLETRQAQLLLNINELTHSRDWLRADIMVGKLTLKDVSDFERMYKDEDLTLNFFNVIGFYEGIGVLVRENLIDVRLVAELWSGDIVGLWARNGSGVLKIREAYDFPRFMIEFEYLAKRVEEFGRDHPELGIKVPDLKAYNAQVLTKS